MATLAVALLLARDSSGAMVVALPLAIGIQLVLAAVWIGHALRQRCRVDLILTACVVAGAAAIGVTRNTVDGPAAAVTLFIAGCITTQLLSRSLQVVETGLNNPTGLLRSVVPIWLAVSLIATLVLSLPIATQSSVPDYRHNLMLHVAHNAFAAVSAACLTGWTSYGFGDDYTLFGQIVLWLVTQFSGCLFAAIGLAIMRPFLRRPISLRGLLIAAFALQGAVIAIAALQWTPSDTPTPGARAWWGAVYSADAMWNTGLTMRPDGLAHYLISGPIYALVTLVALAGSLGIPVIHDLMRGPPPNADSDKSPSPSANAPWKTLPAWEAGAAFWLLVAGAIVLAVCDTPGIMPDALTFKRPFEFGNGQLSLRDDIGFGARASLSIHVSAMLRSAGIQSIALAEGGLTIPSYLNMLMWMVIGGSIAGTAGGVRVSTLVLFVLLIMPNRKAWEAMPQGPQLRKTLIRSAAAFAIFWLLLTAATVAMLGMLTDATRYQIAFDGVAALNNVGLTTGLIVHLSWPARLFMIGVMIAGRILPLCFWAGLSMRIRSCAEGEGDEVSSLPRPETLSQSH